jgi:hypothetical protein
MSFPVVSVLAAVLAMQSSPEGKALAFLARHVPAWSAENKCYSCHNNGDAARALYTARRLGYPLPARALEDTSRWLEQPKKWDHNGGEGAFSDKFLARLQFAAALADALDAGLVKDPKALVQAAELVAEYQRKDGSWQPDGGGNVGSPATYGAALATHQARRVLLKAGAEKYHPAASRAEQWLLKAPVKAVPDAAAVLLALEGKDGAEAAAQRKACLALIREAQAKDGGWGPFVNSPVEPFDTALVVLALSRLTETDGVKDLLKKGRGYLLAAQQKDGSWPATTRPTGGESYAQWISTTGWATLALLATRPRE